MSTGSLSHEAPAVSLNRTMLLERVEKELRAAAVRQPRTVRVEVPAPGITPMAWLRANKGVRPTYWSDRDGMFESAGLGEADVVCDDGAVDYDRLMACIHETATPDCPSLNYYGGFQFDSTAPVNEPWKALGAYRFTLPRFEALRVADTTRFACSITATNGRSVGDQVDEVLTQLRALSFENDAAPSECPAPHMRCDAPTFAAWADAIQRALSAVEHGEVEKVVLARESRFTFHECVKPLDLLARLASDTPNSYHFCFQPTETAAFIGASPERLYKREAHVLESEALAGTRPRGATDVADQALGKELLGSDKDLREHHHVFNALRAAFTQLCDSTIAPEHETLVKLQSCQHLWRGIEGTLRTQTTDADILRALHPTPAVGGHPTQAALRLIPQLEPFDRGWYAGPVGRISSNAAEFAVAIRSGLIHETSLRLYSGAGILRGSEPAAEWDEIENKMDTFLNVLSGHAG